MNPEVRNPEQELRNALCSIFVKNKDYLRDGLQDNEIAAIASAADWMGKCTDFNFSEDAVRNSVIDLFGKSDDERVKMMSHVNSGTVKSVLGYAVQFEDYNAARMAYEAPGQVDLYNALYTRMEARIQEMGSSAR